MMTEIGISAITIGAACIGWVAMDIRGHVTSLLFWPFPTLVTYSEVHDLTVGRR